ncbi:MAG: NADH-quinone oxidoreductase subunit D [Deltaproteobacteria bacterium]|nr:NADH-quinone oxidoreductase subunit D [Deltaproteobacteria bacterium]
MATRLALPSFDMEDHDPEADLLVLNLGPQHPSTHGVFRIKLYLDGEIVVRAVPYLGYLHRGVEKLCEKLTYVQIPPIVDKDDYVAPMANEQAVVMAFEKLLGVEVPRRARYLRTLLAELQRIASHLLWLGTFALDLGGALGGGSTVFLYCFRERELILDLFEDLTGARFHYNTHAIGGNRHDVPEGFSARTRRAMDEIAGRLEEYERLTRSNDIFHERTRGVGVLHSDLAVELGVSGPNLRACGVAHDLRRDAPHHAYDEVPVNVVTSSGGDCFARAEVRLGEIRESIRLVRAVVDGIPEGPLSGYRPVKLAGQVKIPSGQVYTAVESPRGELGTFVIAGGGEGNSSPYRLKIRAPSFHALSALPYLLAGHTVSDVVVILGSLDPIMGEVDR